MDALAPIFEKTYQDYLAKINKLDLQAISNKAGLEWTGQSAIVPLFGIPYRISGNSILDPSGKEPIHSIKVVLCQYLLQLPETPPKNDSWVSYKDFRDAAPLAHTFHVNTAISIAERFKGKLEELKKVCIDLCGYNHGDELNYDLHIKFDALPLIPMLLLFNDADDELPAQSLLLFERRAEHYLNMECLAILGWLLAEKLQGRHG